MDYVNDQVSTHMKKSFLIAACYVLPRLVHLITRRQIAESQKKSGVK